MNDANPNSGQNINPAWQGILNALPESLHNLIIPELKKWDAGVQQKFAEIRSEFDEYKAYETLVKNNIDPAYAEAAVQLADQFQRDPKKVIEQANSAWDLGYVHKDQVQAAQPPLGESGGDQDFLDDDDILKNPKVKAMHDALNQLQQEFQTTKQQTEQERALEEFEEYLNELEKTTTEKNLPFNRTFVTALISQGIDGEDAVKQYHQVLAGSTTVETPPTETSNSTEQPPVVMGQEGSTGAGTPDGSVDFGALSTNDLNATVVQILAQQAQASGQG